jgi:hypothetical protein
LAVGDFWTEFSGDNASMSVQPAGTTVLMLTAFANNMSLGSGSGQPPRLTDGVDNTGFASGNNSMEGNTTNTKIIFDNTNYLTINGNGAGQHTAFTGVEVA